MERAMTADEHLLDALATMWEDADPCPADLADRALFRLELEHLDVEVMAAQIAMSGAGARGPEVASTIIFESPSLSLTVTVSSLARNRRRVDGWITPPAALPVRLHGLEGVREEPADEHGRFAFTDVPSGLVHLTVEPCAGAALRLDRPVATPAFAV
jgi:hypothetical protein